MMKTSTTSNGYDSVIPSIPCFPGGPVSDSSLRLGSYIPGGPGLPCTPGRPETI